jgi:hypothetical protein
LIAGFQFNVDDATVNGASGGDASANGFMISASASTVLGFSLSGSTIPAGNGTLVVLDLAGIPSGLSGIVMSDPSGNAIDFIYDGGDVYGCTEMDACNYNADATMDDGSCDYGTMCWDGSYECDASDCPDQPGGSVEVYYNTSTPIAGFQFNVDGVSITSSGGGAAEAAGFTVSNSASTVVGFSLTGATIPAGEGVLIVLEVDGNTADACLSGLVISDSDGDAVDATVEDCTTIVEEGDSDNTTERFDDLIEQVIDFSNFECIDDDAALTPYDCSEVVAMYG